MPRKLLVSYFFRSNALQDGRLDRQFLRPFVWCCGGARGSLGQFWGASGRPREAWEAWARPGRGLGQLECAPRWTFGWAVFCVVSCGPLGGGLGEPCEPGRFGRAWARPGRGLGEAWARPARVMRESCLNEAWPGLGEAWARHRPGLVEAWTRWGEARREVRVRPGRGFGEARPGRGLGEAWVRPG